MRAVLFGELPRWLTINRFDFWVASSAAQWPTSMEPKQSETCCSCLLFRYRLLPDSHRSTVSLEDMQKRFGEESIWVYNILRGIDHTEGEPAGCVYDTNNVQ